MPSWCRRNVADWVRICGPGWTVCVLDTEPGPPNYSLRYVAPARLLAAFLKRTMHGPWDGPHSADLLRGACL